MTSFVCIQNTYQEIQIALWRENLFTASVSIDKIKASPDLIPTLAQLLANHNLKLSDLNFIGVNQGPGPFTTLRVVIASVNGISFATGMPLIGVDGIEALLSEQQDAAYPQTVVMLNAFSKDVYFGIQQLALPYDVDSTDSAKPSHGKAFKATTDGIQQNGPTIAKGYANIDQFLVRVQEQWPNGTVRFIGNGTALYHTEISTIFGERAFMPTPMIETVSINAIGNQALQLWQQQQNICYQVQPLYLKEFKIGAI